MFQLRPHQEEAVEKLANGKILWGGVGVGKSITAATYYARKEAPRDVYVITTAKKRDSGDWDREFLHVGVTRDRETAVGGVLTVDSWHNIGRYKKVQGAFFIFDEQRVVGSGAWVKSFIHLARRNHWIMLSATPGDTWMDYVPVFVANGYYQNRTQFKDEHVVYAPFTRFPKIDRYVGVNKLVKLRAELLVEMPYLSTTIRDTSVIKVEHDKKLLEKVVKDRWNPFKNLPIRDAAEACGTMRKVVNTDPSRLEAVKKLIKKHPKLIVFYNYDYELESLRSLLGNSSTVATKTKSATGTKMKMGRSGSSATSSTATITTGSKFTLPSTAPTVAEWNGHKHQEIPNTDSWVYLVQYTAGAEGWNCIETNAVCFFSLNYSYKIWEQAYGRIDRMNTPFSILFYYVLMSDAAIDAAIFETLGKKENFNERDFMLGRSGKNGGELVRT
jgi:hypothetical protein